jgi:hypothetical protein
MTDKGFWILFGVMWLIASHAARPESRKDDKTWKTFVLAFVVCVALSIYGAKAP